MNNYAMFGILAIISGVVITALLMAPAQSQDIMIVSGGGGNDTTDCINVGSGSPIIKASTNGDCFVRSVVGSPDISVTNTSNTIVIDFNGTGGSTDCFNVGSGVHLIQNSTGNCYVRTVTNGTGISITNSSTLVTVTNTAPDNTTCANVGTGSEIYKDGECNFRTVLGSGDISVTQQTNTITIDYNGTGSGVSSLTSSNNAITLNASTGHVLVTPKWQLLAQNSTIGGSSSSTTTLVNQASGTDGGLVCSSSGNNGCAEKLTATSVLQGQTFNKITVGLKKALTPTGTLTVGIMDSSKNFLMTCGTLDITTLTTSYVSHSFTCPSSYTVSGVVYVGMSSPTQAGGANVQVGSTNPNQFDTTNSIVSQWITGGTNAWVDASTWDLGSSTANGAWKLEMTGSIFMEADFSAKKHLLVTAEFRHNTTDGLVVRMNNDTGTNYALRTDISGTTTALTSKTHCDILNAGTVTSGDRTLLTMWIDNNQSGDRKMIIGDFATGADTGATTAPANIDFSCKWANTASQITNIVFNGKFTTGSIITVWGYD